MFTAKHVRSPGIYTYQVPTEDAKSSEAGHVLHVSSSVIVRVSIFLNIMILTELARTS